MVPWLVDSCLHAVAFTCTRAQAANRACATYAHANKASQTFDAIASRLLTSEQRGGQNAKTNKISATSATPVIALIVQSDWSKSPV
jgi:hypothetical protein